MIGSSKRMRKTLLSSVLVVELAGCWNEAPSRPVPASPGQRSNVAALDTDPCRRSGDRLTLIVCRRNHDLAWTVTNRTDATLWVFVAPPALDGAPARANAFVEFSNGQVSLHKIQLAGPMDEPIMSGAIALSPGASDSGVIPLGDELLPEAKNLFLRNANQRWPRRQPIQTVSLEVGFAEQRPTDRPIPPDVDREFYLFMALDRDRQELVRSPGLRWR